MALGLGLLGLVATTPVTAQTFDVDPKERNTIDLVVVYMGATTCVPCVQKETKEAVRQVLEAARAAAESRHLGFHTVVAATDTDLDKGLEFLRSTAEFDEAGGKVF
jgi:hypothetical protein